MSSFCGRALMATAKMAIDGKSTSSSRGGEGRGWGWGWGGWGEGGRGGDVQLGGAKQRLNIDWKTAEQR